MSIRDMLRREDLVLTPSEEKIVQLLLAEYPSSGLGTASALARRAGVSDPTVLRLILKIGFQGFADFQAQLLAEVEARLHSPLMMLEAKRVREGGAEGSGSIASAYLRSVIVAMEKSVDSAQDRPFERAARLITGARGRVYLIGGRFSRFLAGMLAAYLAQFRDGVSDLGEVSSRALDQLVDMGRNDVIVVFDYRRYQRDVVHFARQAAGRGAHLILFTDQWLSPVAQHAEITVISPLEAASPFDTLAPAVAQLEAFVAHLLATISDETRDRIETLEAIRSENAITLDAPLLAEPAERAARNFPGPKLKKTGTLT